MWQTYLIVIVALMAVAIQSDESEKKHNALIHSCLTANNLTALEFEEWSNQGDYSDSLEDLENVDMRLKCFTHCMAEKFDLLDDKGFLDADRIDNYEKLNETNRQIIIDCKTEYDNGKLEKCDYAFNMLLCYMENIKQTDE
ncbi:Odorant-binding protein 57c [Drosophila willistoni]|uniref:Odorant-binding protein 57c n=1 Tax=Drosophila willistoni TaxID=7260 RepID=B4MKG1_DROWI|nr:general odorant-binding protein 57c [Drosophila willistoni]EDW72600.2 Odorant-binding protein 57c [Drosophila willistoni]